MDSLIRVNAYWLSEFLWKAGWHIDADDHPLNRLNMENATSRAILCEDYLIPELKELSVTQRRLVKETLKYALNFFGRKDWEWYTQEALPDITDTPEEMFADIWGMLFPGEPWHLDSAEGYFRHDDRDDALFLDRYRYGRFQGLKGTFLCSRFRTTARSPSSTSRGPRTSRRIRRR